MIAITWKGDLVLTLIALGILYSNCRFAYANVNTGSKIINGGEAQMGAYPWVVSVRVDNIHTCVGSIVTEQHIITAGHCVQQVKSIPIDLDRVSVRVGSTNQYSGGKVLDVSSIIIHSECENFLHDMAIIKLNQSLEFGTKINKIELAPKDSEVASGTPVIVAGWGVNANGTHSAKLQYLSMTAISNEECDEQVNYGYESILCLQHPLQQGICRGDYGAGIVAENKLIGVASFSFGPCGAQFPDISSRISYYSDWIKAWLG